MDEVSADQLKAAVKSQHGGTPIWVGSEPVKEISNGETVWEGTVHVFNLDDHPSATMAYAWSAPAEGSKKPRLFAVLHLGGIRSPLDAVRASIAAEQRAKT